MLAPCLDCGELTRNGSRCPDCEAIRRRIRKAAGHTGHVGRHIPRAVRRTVVHRTRGLCARCQARPVDEVHHKDSDPSNNRLSNLEALCAECHREAERKIRAR